ncbi:unnamed protein product [Somion occarium]
MRIESKHLELARLVAFGTVSLFSVIILALSAHWIATTETKFVSPFYDPYAAFALAVSLLSLLTLPAMLIIDHIRKGAFTSKIIFELSWIGTLAILWLASAAVTSQVYANSTLTCWRNFTVIIVGCREAQAIQAFGHLNWLLLFFYSVGLAVLSLVSHNNGRDVWHYSVKDAQFATSVTSPAGTPGVYEPKDPMTGPSTQNVPVPQQTYYPQTVPQSSPYVGTPNTLPPQSYPQPA